MGLRDFMPFVRKRWPSAISPVGVRAFKRVAVDAPYFAQKHHKSRCEGGASEVAKDLVRMRDALQRRGAERVEFVFDGERRPSKRHRPRPSLADVDAALEGLEGAARERRREALEKQARFLGRGEMEEVATALAAAGLCVTRAPHDAEQLCAQLGASGRVDAVVTDDADALAFGAPVVWRCFGRADEVVSLEELLRQSGLDRRAFVDFCILCGTDFNERVPSVGPVHALASMQTFGSIERMLKLKPRLDGAACDFATAREIFHERPPAAAAEAVGEPAEAAEAEPTQQCDGAPVLATQ